MMFATSQRARGVRPDRAPIRRVMFRGGLICLSCGLAAAIVTAFSTPTVHAQASDTHSAAGGSSIRPSGLDAGSSPEELLQALREARPPNEVIPSAGAVQRAAAQEGSLWPEGWTLVGVTGRVRLEEEQWVFDFLDPETGKPVRLKLLPNATLEIIARTASADADHRLTVFGTLTVYRKENYLLVKSVTRAATPPSGAADPQSPTVLPPDASADEVAEAMKKQRPAQEVMTGAPATPRFERSSISSAPVIPEGSPVVNRPGRLVRSGLWWTFVTDTESADQPDPPFKVLPSRTLEMMADLAERDPTGLVFVVSGELTAFQGENYFLPKGGHRRIDTGNLSK